MKRLFYISVFLLFFIKILHAQTKGFEGGLLFGLVPSQVDGDTYGGYNKIGIEAGGFTRFVFNKTYSLQMEIKYIQKGAKAASKDNFLYYKSSLNYMEVSVSLQYLYHDKFIGEAGISLGYLFKASETFGSLVVSPPDPPFESYEIAGQVGIGYIISDNWIIMNHFSYSILPIRWYPKDNRHLKDLGCNNNVIRISVYYKFGS